MSSSDGPTIVLHIGTNKTGTSAIQKYLNAQRETLARQGLLYPATGCAGEAHYAFSDALGFRGGRKDPQWQAARQSRLRTELDAEISLRRPRTVILSSEFFVHGGKPQAVAEFFLGYAVRVLVYLRRHDHWWLSAYNQSVRHQAHPAWPSGLRGYLRYQREHNPRYGDYLHLLDRWAAVFGRENIWVRPCETQQNRPHILADFLATLGYAQLAPAEASRVNESIGEWALKMIDIAQRAELDDSARTKIIDYILRQAPPDDPPTMPAALARRLIARHADDYAYIARAYLGRADGRLFFEPLPAESSAPPPPSPGAEEIMSWTVRALTSTAS